MADSIFDYLGDGARCAGYFWIAIFPRWDNNEIGGYRTIGVFRARNPNIGACCPFRRNSTSGWWCLHIAAYGGVRVA